MKYDVVLAFKRITELRRGERELCECLGERVANKKRLPAPNIINSKPEDVLRMELDTHCIVHMVNFQYVFNDEDAGPSDLRNQLPINPGATELV